MADAFPTETTTRSRDDGTAGAGLSLSPGGDLADALSIEGVGHRFGAREALHDVSLRVPAGRFVALLGPNGAGKTTLFSVATRLYDNRTGRIRIFDRDLRRQPTWALAEMGVVFQARTLDLDLTVRQNLTYHAALHGLAGGVVGARIATLLARIGLADRAGDKVRDLSGGQARRVEIARALVHSPRLLMLDEPTVGLDLDSRAAIVAIVRGLVQHEGLSVMWATHLFDEVEPQDAVYVLHRGRIVANGTAAEIAGADGLEAAFRTLTSVPAAPGAASPATTEATS